MHADAAHPWTVPELAAVSGLSRAAFARSFQHALGQAPMQYLTDWRMTLARDHLRSRRADARADRRAYRLRLALRLCRGFPPPPRTPARPLAPTRAGPTRHQSGSARRRHPHPMTAPPLAQMRAPDYRAGAHLLRRPPSARINRAHTPRLSHCEGRPLRRTWRSSAAGAPCCGSRAFASAPNASVASTRGPLAGSQGRADQSRLWPGRGLQPDARPSRACFSPPESECARYRPHPRPPPRSRLGTCGDGPGAPHEQRC